LPERGHFRMRLTRLSDRLFQKMQTLPAIHPNNTDPAYFF